MPEMKLIVWGYTDEEPIMAGKQLMDMGFTDILPSHSSLHTDSQFYQPKVDIAAMAERNIANNAVHSGATRIIVESGALLKTEFVKTLSSLNEVFPDIVFFNAQGMSVSIADT